MLMRSIALALSIAVSAPSVAAETPAKKAAPSHKPKKVAEAPKLRHQCKVGPYEKQTRLVMETVRDKPVYLAYWSSNGPFHCSFESWPGDGRATWIDSKAGTVINLISGTMLIERTGDKYFVHARDVDRMPYCGTFGLISGVLTVPVKKGDCDWKDTSGDEAGQLKQNDAPAADTPSPANPDAAPPSPTAGPAKDAPAAQGSAS